MLILIDLQNYYLLDIPLRQRKELISNICLRVKEAIHKGEEIINVRGIIEGPLSKEIDRVLPPSAHRIGKDQFDGSSIIINYCKKNYIPLEEVELCGVYAQICVLQTWLGLKRNGIKVRPVKKLLTYFHPNREVELPEGYLDVQYIRRKQNKNKGNERNQTVT